MEGPTPVSALIHAATMVTAGVYLMCRMNPLLAVSHAGPVIASIGVVTAFVAATIACAQQDIKKVLAYSTISQLGYMFLAVGSGAYQAAIFLMVAHAFFKGLLFLGAGSVIHGLHDEQDLKKMGGLYRFMKYTAITFVVGWLAIAGLPPLSGFWAKSDVLANAFGRYWLLYVIGAVTAILTAYYMSRLFMLAFLGDERWRAAMDTRGGHGGAGEPHESNWIMLAPLFVLAVLAFFGGLLDLPWAHGPLAWLDSVFGSHTHLPHESAAEKWILALLDVVFAVGGIVVGMHWWRKAEHPELEPAMLRRAWYLDDIYDATIGRPGAALALRRVRLRQEGDRRRRRGHRRRRPSGRRRAASHPDRLRPPVCPRDHGGPGGAAGVHVHEGLALMHNDTAFPYLTTLILLPIGAAVAAALVPRVIGERAHRRWVMVIGMAGALATLALAITIAVRFRVGPGGYQMVSRHPWASNVGVGWTLGVDGISLFLILMAAVLFPVAIIGGRVRRDLRAWVIWLLILEAGCIGSFVALDLIVFFVFFEATLVPVYFLMVGWGFAERSRAAVKFFVYTFAGSAFLLVGMVWLAVIHQQQTGQLTFDITRLMSTHLSLAEQVLLFCGFTAAFAVKAPVWPFHTWSPDAYAQSPTGGVVALAAVMAKLGTYGVVRFDLNLFPRASVDLAPVLLTLGVIGILYGAVVACVQKDLKRLLAYSSLAHLGFVVLGAFALTTQAVTGSVLQMVNHGLVIAALFLIVGWVYERRGTWQTSGLRGLQRPAPMLAAAFTLAMMASIGLPGLNGFVGEFLILSGTFLSHRWWAVVATVGVVLAALYLLWAYQQAFHHKPDPADARTRDLTWREGVVILPLLALIVALGVYPKPVLDRITPSVAAGDPRRPGHRADGADAGADAGARGRDRRSPARAGAGRLGARDREGAAVNSVLFAAADVAHLRVAIHYTAIMPELIMLGGALVTLGVSALLPGYMDSVTAASLTLLTGASSLVASLVTWYDTLHHGARVTIGGAVVEDGFSDFIAVLVSCAVILTAFVIQGWQKASRSGGRSCRCS